MSKHCAVCLEDNVQEGHEGTKKHLKNAGLFDLAKFKKKFSENRDGIKVTCSVTPTAYNSEPLLTDREQSRLEVSIRPQVEIRLTFTLRNDNTHEIIFGGIVMLNKKRKLTFTLHNENVTVPCAHIIQPEQYFKEQISITFESPIIGVYQMSTYFFFLAVGNDQPIIIYKEIEVTVKRENNFNRKVGSPYTKETVSAEKIISSPEAKRKLENNKYLIPSKNYWHVFEYLEKMRRYKNGGSGHLTDVQNALLESIRLIFKTGPVHNNYIQYFRHLLWCEEVGIAAKLANYNMMGAPLLPMGRQANTYALEVPGLAEKRPSVMPGDFVHVRPHGQNKFLFESLITDVEDTFAVLGAFAPEFKRYFVPGARFDIRFFMSRVPLERMHEAVSDIQSSDATSKIFPRKTNPPRINIIPDDKFFNKHVARNPEQRSVVEHVVGGSSGTAPYLVLGPPGTGKTVTIVEAILQLARDPNNRILVCTDSNMAADHVASKLVHYKKLFSEKEFILRASSEFRPWEGMPSVLKRYSNGTKRANWSPVSIGRFLNHRIVITTLIHAAKFARELKYKKYERKTTHIFIDEAAQASEPAALVPVCGLLVRGGALVLAGDPRQLGPICISGEAKAQGLGVSLMERIKNKCDLYSDENPDPNFFMKLKINYRSHADILSIPNELFYNGELESRAQRDKISNKDILGQKKLSRAILFHGVLSREQREDKSPSFFNDMEVEIVKMYAEALVNTHKVSQKEIGVITPYIMQVYRIQDSLERVKLTNIDVGTVEAFQSREKRVIILSCVRANCDLFGHDAKFQLGFLDSAQRFNVAITRAKAKLIVIGNPLCLKKDEKWLKYMLKCREFDTYTGFDSGVETDADLEEVLQQIAPIMNMIKKIKVSKE